MSFEIITVVIVVIIFGIFSYGAYRAEKTVNAKVKERQEALKAAAKAKAALPKAATMKPATGAKKK